MVALVDHTATARAQRLTRCWSSSRAASAIAPSRRRCGPTRRGSSATASASRCKRCWHASPNRSPTNPSSTSSPRPCSAELVWRRLRAVMSERRGILILDGTSFPEAWARLGRHDAAVLWGVGQDCQLPSRHDGGALDRAARLVCGRDVVSARPVADAGAPAAGADPGRRALPGEVAACAHAGPASPGRRLSN